MGSYTDPDKFYETCSRKTESYENVLNAFCKNDVSLKNSLKGDFLPPSLFGIREQILDLNDVAKKDNLFSECASDSVNFSIVSDPPTHKEASDAENGLSKMLSLTLNLGEDSLLKSVTCDDGVSLADLYFGNAKQPPESDEAAVVENSLELLLASARKNSADINTVPSDCIITNSLLSSFDCDGKSMENNFDCNSALEASLTSIAKDSSGTGDLNFSLADLYFNGSKQDAQSKTDFLSEAELVCELEDMLVSPAEAVEQSDSERCSSHEDEEEEDFVDGHVDLCSTVKASFVEDFQHSYHFPGVRKHTFQKNHLVKTKPTLFCKVLCAKPKQKNLSSVPKYASNLFAFIQERDYNKYFWFDRPSPDDIVKEKQKNIIK